MFTMPVLFTNGQSYGIRSDYTKLHYVQSTTKVKTDYFSNKIWESLDEPKRYLNLKRFEKRYGVTITNAL